MELKLQDFKPNELKLSNNKVSISPVDNTKSGDIAVYHSLVSKAFTEGPEMYFQPQLEQLRHKTITSPPWRFFVGSAEVCFI